MLWQVIEPLRQRQNDWHLENRNLPGRNINIDGIGIDDYGTIRGKERGDLPLGGEGNPRYLREIHSDQENMRPDIRLIRQRRIYGKG